eukprot:CAMPEP_0113276396 /NCGR_PEP_ID=MMETSP0008_2-20120614/25468_1 /TAXON_ID=97485 /ORGANISM="Prymnesium parvum" /LENGTH=89 /DNA_ID=CAMNT_0000126189 /DNA_START=252 /DNA_END=518 /DNA_ORIENTATION=+ /assembly_acc=CAM_ASM_000153
MAQQLFVPACSQQGIPSWHSGGYPSSRADEVRVLREASNLTEAARVHNCSGVVGGGGSKQRPAAARVGGQLQRGDRALVDLRLHERLGQ